MNPRHANSPRMPARTSSAHAAAHRRTASADLDIVAGSPAAAAAEVLSPKAVAAARGSMKKAAHHQQEHQQEALPVRASPKKPATRRSSAKQRPMMDLRAFLRAAQRVEVGEGTPAAPLELPMADEPNESGCYHCPTSWCECVAFDEMFHEALEESRARRVTEVAGKNHLCAKSILPHFITRMAAELEIDSRDTFYDLGSGNGSVVFQTAFMTGARCVGVELSAHNADVSRRVWAALKPKLEAYRGAPMPEVEIITGDLADVITADDFGRDGHTVVWTANLLMPRSVTHFMSEVFRRLPRGCRIMCLDDLYPHGRESCRWRDPEAFELFQMTDYAWPPHSVEWMRGGGGRFYRHVRV